MDHTFPSCSCATLESAYSDAGETNIPHPYLHELHTHSGCMNQFHAACTLGSAPSESPNYCSTVMQDPDSHLRYPPWLRSATSSGLTHCNAINSCWAACKLQAPEVWANHEVFCLSGCQTMLFGRCVPVFQRKGSCHMLLRIVSNYRI